MSLEGLGQLDRRIIEREIRRGNLDVAEYERYLASLPDVADKAVTGEEAGGERAAGDGEEG